MSEIPTLGTPFRGFSYRFRAPVPASAKPAVEHAPASNDPKTDGIPTKQDNSETKLADQTDQSIVTEAPVEQTQVPASQPAVGFTGFRFRPGAAIALAPAPAQPAKQSDEPNPDFFKAPAVDLRVRINYKIHEGENWALMDATAENGRQTKKLKIFGPLALREMKNSWLSVSGQFKPDRKSGGYNLDCKRFERAWPKYQAATLLALRDVFGVTIEKFGLPPSERDKRIAALQSLADGCNGLLQAMANEPETYINRLGFSESERLTILKKWFDVTGPDRVRKALSSAGIEPSVATRIMAKWQDKVHEALDRNPYLVVEMGAKFSQAENVAKTLGANVEADRRIVGYINGVLNDILNSGNGSTTVSVGALI
jgi:hypothetical protein